MTKAKKTKPEKQTNEAEVASLVHGGGTDDEIREACERRVGGWESLNEREKLEVIEGMRTHHELPTVPELQFDPKKSSSRIREGDNATLQTTRLLRTLATQSQPLVNARLSDIVNFHHKSNGRGCDETDLNAHLAFVAGCEPEDPAQAALAVQMHATHEAAMRALAMIGQQSMVDQITAVGNLSTKLLNAYARQAEALAKLKRGGVQVVKHLTVNATSQTVNANQAVVAGTVGAGGVPGNVEEQAHEQYDGGANGPAMLSQDPQGNGMPISGDEGAEAVPSPRGKKHGSAEG